MNKDNEADKKVRKMYSWRENKNRS